jgi:hypothetical protein
MPIYQKVFNSPYDKDNTDKYKPPQDDYQPNPKFNKYDSNKGSYEDKVKSMLPTAQNKVVDLQVYQPAPPKGPNPYTGKKPFMPIEPIALTTPYVPPQYQNYVNNMMKDFYTPFIYKDYNIQIGGPNADHNRVSSLFEDMSISQEYYTSYKSLNDRKNLIGYIRGNFISNKDGENIDFSGSNKSLNSKLNFLSLNPYDSSGSVNPYTNIQDNLLLYTSCYPITKNESGQSMCSKFSVGVNIRVHGLILTEFISQYSSSNEFTSLLNGKKDLIDTVIEKFNNGKKDKNYLYNVDYYETWREIYYYNFIRNSICSNNVCPNFIQSYCFFQTINPDIKFPHTNKDNKDNISAAISILTESPDYSLHGWGSNVQKTIKNIVSMTHSGYKLPILWVNILQQIIISFYVMFKYKFVHKNMSIDNNFFIKIVDRSPTTFSVWKYNIKGINYYLRNYGNLLLVDAGFKKKDPNSKSTNILINTLKKFNENNLIETADNNLIEIYLVLYNNMKLLLSNQIFKKQNNNSDDQNINKFIGVTDGEGKDSWDTIIDSTNKIFEKYDSYFNKIQNIQDIEKTFDELFDNLILETLKNTVHNRIGTQLRDTEIPFIKKDYFIQPKRGDIIVLETNYDSYIFVQFICSLSNGLYKCITKENNEFIIDENIKRDLTSSYVESNVLKFDIKEGEPISNNDDVIDDSFIIS